MRAKTVINLVLICWAVFITGVSLTLITPFYPTEALSKGVTVTQSGVVLSTVFIATLVFTPIFGKANHYHTKTDGNTDWTICTVYPGPRL